MRRSLSFLASACAGLACAVVVVGASSSSQSTVPDEQQRTARPGWPCAGRPDPTYVRLAEATGGQLFLFHPSELAQSATLMGASMTHGETLFRAAGLMGDGLHEIAITVDPSVQSVLFSVSVQCLQVVEIARPSGATLQASDDGVDYQQFEAGRVVVVRAPEPGLWTIRASGSKLFLVIVQAASSGLSLGRVQLVSRRASGLTPVTSPAPPGQRQLVSLSLAGADDWRVGLVSATGEPLGPVTPVGHEGHDAWLGEMIVPRVPFRVAVTGTEPGGRPFVRVHAPLLGLPAR